MFSEIRLYRKVSGTWERQALPARFVAGWSFSLVDRGGYAEFNLNLAAELDDRELPVLPEEDDRVDVLFDGVYAYRGYVERVRPSVTEDGRPSFRVDGAGRMARLETILADCQFCHPGSADVGDVFGWLAEKRLTGDERLGEMVLAIAEVGYPVEAVAFFDASVRQGFDRMAEAAVDSLIWGFDVAVPEEAGDDAPDRLYVQQRPTSVTTEAYRLRLGRDITLLEQPSDLSEMVNCVKFRGGPSKVGNLVYNGSFERPLNPGETESGSLLVGGNFGNGLGWTLTSATIEESGGHIGAYAHSEGHFCRITGSGSARQAYNAGTSVVDIPFVLTFYYAVQRPGSVSLDVDVVGLDSGGGSTGSIFSETITTTSRSYRQYRRQFTPTAAGTERIRITISRSAGTDAAMVDDCFLFRNDLLVQDGWKQFDHGSGSARVDWACEDNPWHGCYCIRAVSHDCDSTDANTVRIRPTKDHWISARRSTQYVVRVMMRTSAAKEFRLGLAVKMGGSIEIHWGADQNTNATGQWTRYQSTLTSSAAETIYPVIELRENGTFFIDACYVFESGVLTNVHYYTPGEQIELYARANTRRSDLAVHASNNAKVKSAALPFTSGDIGFLLRVTGGSGWSTGDYEITAFDGEYVTLDSSPAATSTTGGAGDVLVSDEISDAAADSIEAYGLRETVLDVPEIEDLDQAKRYITGYLNRFAAPLARGTVVLEPCDVHVRYAAADGEATPMGMVALSGAKDPLEDQFPVRITYSQTQAGPIRCELELTNRQPDLALLIKKALAPGGGGRGSSFGAGGSVGSGQAGPDDDEDVSGQLVVSESGAAVSTGAGELDFKAGFDLTEAGGVVDVDLDLGEYYGTQPFKVGGDANENIGTATLVAGAVTVNNTRVTANSIILLTPRATGAGVIFEDFASRAAGTSFKIQSTDGADTRVVQWMLIEPA